MTDTAPAELELDGYFRKNEWQHTPECMNSTERFCMAACHDARHADGWTPPGGWPEGLEPEPDFDPNAIAWEDGPPGYFFGATDNGWEIEIEPDQGDLLHFAAKLGDVVLHGVTVESNIKAAVQAQINAYALDNTDPGVVGSADAPVADEVPTPEEATADAPDLVEPDVAPEPEEPPAPATTPVDDYDTPVPASVVDEYDAPAPAPAAPADEYDAPAPVVAEPEPTPPAAPEPAPDPVVPEPPAADAAPEPVVAEPTESGVAASGDLSVTVVPGEPAPAPAEDRNPDAMPIPEDHHYESKFACIIRCKDEADQKRIFDELTERGYEIKLTAV